MGNVIQRGTAYFGKEDEATSRVGESKISNVDSEQQAIHLIHWKYSGLICMVVKKFGLHGENPQYLIGHLTH